MTDTAGTAIDQGPLEPTTIQKVVAEGLGTFVLVFFGVGTAIATGADVVTTGLAFGLTVLVMAYAVGRISGGHFNPAVTVGAAVSGRLAWRHTPPYFGAQLVGGLLGGGVLWCIFQGFPTFDSTGSFGQNSFGDHGSGLAWWAAFLVEAVTTFVFLVAILSVTDERNEHPALAPLAIGLSLAMIHFATINLTGTSVNPARSIGAALYAGTDAIAQLWLFILAPLLGGALAGLVHPLLFGRDQDPVPGSGVRFSRAPAAGVPGYGAPDAYQQQWNQLPPQGQAQQQAQQAWPPQPPEGWQQPHYPTAQPQPQAWPPAPPGQLGQPPSPGVPDAPPAQPAQPSPPAPPEQSGGSGAWQQPWPGNRDDDGHTQARRPQ